ncbi:MAG: hypothetical protein ABMA64_06070 [Myxococcota bacterium]
MTFGMMWVHGDAVLAAADAAETRATGTSERSGTTALGQQDEFRGYAVHDRVMKLAMLGGRVLVVGAGDKDDIVRTVLTLRTLLDSGLVAPAAVEALSRRIPRPLEAHILVGCVSDGRPLITELRPDRSVHHHRTGCIVVGSATPEVAEGMRRGSADADPALPAQWALACTQACMHMACSLEQDMLRKGIGGVLCGALVRSSGIVYQPKTVWVFADESLLDAVIADQPTADLGGLVVSVVGDNLHYVRSSFYGDFSEAVILAIPCDLSDDEAHAWADAQRGALHEPDLIVFLNLMKHSALIVAHASEPGCPVAITAEPFGFAVEERLAPVIRKALTRQGSVKEVSLTWYQWWVHGSGPANV